MVLFRFLLLFLLIFYALRFVSRLFFSRPTQGRNRRNQYNTGQQRREGDVSVQYSAKSEKRFKKDIGEYVKYEEVKED